MKRLASRAALASLFYWACTTGMRTAQAEYRAYELEISTPSTEKRRRVLTSLDPLQYPQYYPVGPEEVITLIATWRCPGSTAKTPICPKPEKLDPQKPE